VRNPRPPRPVPLLLLLLVLVLAPGSPAAAAGPPPDSTAATQPEAATQPATAASPQPHWALAHATHLYEMGVLDVMPESLDRLAARREVVRLFVRALGLPLGQPGPGFADVPTNDPDAGVIAAARLAELARGDVGGLFRPDSPVSRAELAAFLERGFAKTALLYQAGFRGFADTEGHWALPHIVWSMEAGAIRGFPDYTFRPDQPCTLGQVVKVLETCVMLATNPATLPAEDVLVEVVRQHNLHFARSFDAKPWNFDNVLATTAGDARRTLEDDIKWLRDLEARGRTIKYEGMETSGFLAGRSAFRAVVVITEQMTEIIDGQARAVKQKSAYFLRKADGRWVVYK
jgi:hypothetical protein